jgi:hypothetical protein
MSMLNLLWYVTLITWMMIIIMIILNGHVESVKLRDNKPMAIVTWHENKSGADFG